MGSEWSFRLLRYLETVELKKANYSKDPNGARVVAEYTLIQKYKVQSQYLNDEVSASIYGSNLVNVKRISSPLKDLEKFLLTKVNNKKDNVSKYFIFVNGVIYKIISVTDSRVDIERIWNHLKRWL